MAEVMMLVRWLGGWVVVDWFGGDETGFYRGTRTDVVLRGTPGSADEY
jgi:hypothetical protein